MGKIIKSQLIDNIYEKTDVDRQKIQVVIDSFLDELKEALVKGDSVELRGFGTFENKLRNARENARNPKTGEIVKIPPHYIASFKAGKELKQALWDLKVEE